MRMLKLACVNLVIFSTAAYGFECPEIAERMSRVDRQQGQVVRAGTGAAFEQLYRECDAQNTFAGQKLPTFAGKPLRCSTDPNRVRYVLQYPDRTVAFEAKASVDADGSAAACGPQRSATDQCQTWLSYDQGSTRKYTDAEKVPFVVVPMSMPSSDISFTKATGIGKGDLAVVVSGTRCAFGVVGDSGPYFRLGEISVAAHAELGNPQCAGSEKPCTRLIGGGGGRGIASGVRYLIFPKTRPDPLTAENVVAESAKAARQRLDRFLETYAK